MSGIDVNSKQFWKAITVWIKNPHVVNRRLCGAIEIGTFKCIHSDHTFEDVISHFNKFSFKSFSSQSDSAFPHDMFSIVNDHFTTSSIVHMENDILKTESEESVYYVVLQKLLPRTTKFNNSFQISLLNVKEELCIIFNYSESNKISLTPNFPYILKLLNGKIVVNVNNVADDNASLKWLKNCLIPRIYKWTCLDTNTTGLNSSLNLISLFEYNNLYQQLKEKYGCKIVQIWPEATDPSKYVYEDIAIATYLLLLWKNERSAMCNETKQSFVDLGCGNGLLVYILNSEGHSGKGVDIRKRDIWDLYPDNVNLEVQTIEPNELFLYKDADWIIGNHSDELSPWVPVIAARSSYKCNFFLLPCCAYEFNGSKYQRKNSSKSTYNEYLEYIQMICQQCGIFTEVDRLKIPSTKRICLIGTTRNYMEEDYDSQLLKLRNFIENASKSSNQNVNVFDNMESWQKDFKPRDAIERVQNCTKVDKTIINHIIDIVTTHLLEEKNYIDDWNIGGHISISELPKLLSEEMLKALKNECGGLQTLLKNNHSIFEVSNGNVRLRRPVKKDTNLYKKKTFGKKNKSGNYKVKSCWFFKNHPQGCPLSQDYCKYLHDEK